MTQTRSEIARLLDEYAVTPRRRLGQNFLADPNIIRRIVALAGEPHGSGALEIGLGTGTLTRALSEAGFPVTGFEVDRRFEPVLSNTLSDLDVDIRFEDATRMDFDEFDRRRPWVMVSNLPYNVGTPLMLDLLRKAAGVHRFVVMVQGEVAERLTARPGSKAYGLPSVVTGLYGHAHLAFRVGPQVFLPAPKVESAVVVIKRTSPPDKLRNLAVRIAAAGFEQRRKMLRSSLRSVIPEGLNATLRESGISPQLRAERVSPQEYLNIAHVLEPKV